MPDLSVSEAVARAALVDVESYDLVLDLTAAPVTARSEVRFRCRQPGSETFADLSVAATRSAVLNGKPAGQPEDGRLRLSGLLADNVLTVEAEVEIGRFTDPADGAEYLHVMTFPDGAGALMACFDQPDLGGSMTLTARVPDGWGCYANGARVEGEEWRFAPVPGLEPYLVKLCAGPFTMRPGNVGRRRSLAGVDAKLDEFAATARRAVEHYEQLLGVPCPYPEYDILFVPALDALAMSVPGLMLVSETLLADRPDDFITMVCWHEVAHFWFGSHVSMRWWDDLWLDEAMATYLSNERSWTEFAYRSKASAYRADELPSREPVSSPVATSADALARPPALTYAKGAAVIRQLEALIGADALNRGLTDYLTRYGGSTAALEDLVGCWSRASGRDLTQWSQEWLRTPGASVLRPDIALTQGCLIESLAVRQEEGTRTHVIGIGLYDLTPEGLLRRRRLVRTEVTGERTVVPELAGEPLPDALVLNDGDLDYARVRFDPLSQRVLAAAALEVGDPVTEAVCWNAFWDMVTSATLPAAEFADLVGRRLASAASLPEAAVEVLLERAVLAADVWAHPALRPGIRERLADAIGTGNQRGFAAAAESQPQLALLRTWLGNPELDADLRARVLFTLAARGLADDAEIDALASLDPVAGEVNRATGLAMRPTAAAKAAAWEAALSATTSPQLAQAHARGIWVPGQEPELMAGYRDRYFAEALPALRLREPEVRRELGGLLFPATLVSAAVIDAADAAGDAEQAAIMRSVLAARRR